jgi:N-methylhydantoinase B/acetone carboxylase alpha subunit
MSKPDTPADEETEFPDVEPPIGWDGKTLQEMKDERDRLTEETGRYRGIEELEMKENDPFKYEQMYARMRGAVVSARETALNVASSPIVKEIGELCFQLYTPEGDAIAVSTGIIVHVHTGSLAIKRMIDDDYEHTYGIEPGDIFSNNDNVYGNVHTTDLHTFVPIFHDGELVAWADGVNHVMDIGAPSPGHSVMDGESRWQDGFYVTNERIGEEDTRYPGWETRGQRGTRMPTYWDLDEKCRMVGCHMIRNAVQNIIDEVGIEAWKQFSYEAVEEGRQIMVDRTQERLVPGTYRSSNFFPFPYAEDHSKQSDGVDDMLHLPLELEVKDDGIAIDMEGASPPGRHPYNCTEGSMTGGLWVNLSQSLLSDGKVNDGAYVAMDTNFPTGSVVDANDHSLAYQLAWGSISPTFNGFQNLLGRGFFARGYLEEVTCGYGAAIDSVQGGGTSTLTDEYYGVGPFDFSASGYSASAVTDGIDHGYAMFNPESDMGDIEKWEMGELGALHLGRRKKPNTAGHGKYRGGTAWEGVRTFWENEHVELGNWGFGNEGWTMSGGLSGGYPWANSYMVTVHDTDLFDRVQAGDPYPVGDQPPGDLESHVDGDVNRSKKSMMFPTDFQDGDLLHWKVRGGQGFGDPMERPIEKVVEDVEDNIFTPDIVENVYGVVGTLDEETREFTLDKEATEKRREEIMEERREKSMSYEEFWEQNRQKVKDGDIHAAEKRMYNKSFDMSEDWASEFCEFWDLDDDHTFDLEGGD